MSSDEKLALRAAQGDRRAFEEIYSRYHQALYRFCLAMMGNPQDAQDALQNTMVKVLRALPGEKREIRLKPWLYRIARNESVETLRRRHDSEELDAQQSAGTEVTEVAATRERLRTLLDDLDQLPERQRAALVMRELAGLDFDQIGASFGTSTAVARQTLYEARLSLRQLEAGREMRCTEVMRELSDADGRVTRRREISAHLRSCADCRAFKEEIGKRHEDLAALSPLPLAASVGLLHGMLAGKAGGAGASGAGGGSGIAGTAGAGAGKAVATSALVKSAAAVVVAAALGTSAADRGGLIHLPFTDGGSRSAQSAADAAAPSPREGSAGTNSVSREENSATVLEQPADRGVTAQESDRASKQRAGSNSSGEHRGAAQGTSRSHSGLTPPGGGYGRSASERKGRPEQTPEAAHGGGGRGAAKPHPHEPPQTSPEPSPNGNNHPSKPTSPPANPAETAPDNAPSPSLEPPTEANRGAADAAAHSPKEAR